MRFKNAVHAHDGTEEEKVAAAKQLHPRQPSTPTRRASPARPNDEDAETVRRLQQNVVLPQAVPNRRLEEAQGRVQTGAQTQEAGLQQRQIPRRRAVERGDEGRRAQGRDRDDFELRVK